MDRRRDCGKDGNSRCATGLLTTFLLVAIMSLLVNSVASSSRPLEHLQANEINARDWDMGPPAVPGPELRSSTLHRTVSQRGLLQSLPRSPKGGGGSNPVIGPRTFPPPPVTGPWALPPPPARP